MSQNYFTHLIFYLTVESPGKCSDTPADDDELIYLVLVNLIVGTPLQLLQLPAVPDLLTLVHSWHHCLELGANTNVASVSLES